MVLVRRAWLVSASPQIEAKAVEDLKETLTAYAIHYTELVTVHDT